MSRTNIRRAYRSFKRTARRQKRINNVPRGGYRL